jgi:protein-tyrosine phosphatase
MPEHKAFDYSEITPLIFIGQNVCCRTHFDGTLTAQGVRADMSLEKERIDQPYGVDMFLWLPTEDHAAVSHEKADLGILTLRYFAEKNIPCFVHCKNGHGRAPMLVAAYLIADQGMTAEEAVAYLKERRPVIHLQDVQKAFLKEREARRK